MIPTTLRRVASTALLLLLALLLGTGPAVAAPDSDPGGPVRPADGEVVLTRGGSGPGCVEVEGGPTDAVLTLARGDRAVRSIYVRAGGKAVLRDVADGEYAVFVSSGHDWDDAVRRFTRDPVDERWPGEYAFSTETGPDGTSSSVWTFTLTTTPDGNIVPEPVAADRVPR